MCVSLYHTITILHYLDSLGTETASLWTIFDLSGSCQALHAPVNSCPSLTISSRGDVRIESVSMFPPGSSSGSISTSFDDVGDALPKSNRCEESTRGSNESCSTSSYCDSENEGSSLSPSSRGGGDVEMDEDSDCGVGQRPVLGQLWLACDGSGFFEEDTVTKVRGSSGGVGSCSLTCTGTGTGVSATLLGSEFRRAASILECVFPPRGRDVRRL